MAVSSPSWWVRVDDFFLVRMDMDSFSIETRALPVGRRPVQEGKARATAVATAVATAITAILDSKKEQSRRKASAVPFRCGTRCGTRKGFVQPYSLTVLLRLPATFMQGTGCGDRKARWQ